MPQPSVLKHLRESYGNSAVVWLGIALTAAGHVIFKIMAPIAITNWVVGLISRQGDYAAGLWHLSVLYAVAILLGLAGDYIFIRHSDRRYVTLVGRFHDSIMRMPIDFFRRMQAGTLSTLFRNHLDGTINLFRLIRVDIIPLAIATVVPAIVLGTYNLAVGLLFGAGILLRGYLTWQAAGKLKPLRKAALKVYGELSGVISDQMSQMPLVLASAQIPLARRKVTNLAHEEGRLFWIRHRTAAFYDVAGNAVTAACFAGTLAMVGFSDLGGPDQLRLAILSMIFVTQALQAVSVVAELHQRWSERWEHTAASLRELDSVAAPHSSAGLPPDAPLAGSLELRDVTFAYSLAQRSKPVVENLSLSIPDGTHVAILGPNGAGKSTLVNLIFRFDSPTEGKVLVGGVDTTLVATEELYRTLSYVPQDLRLFNTTLRENLFLFEPDAPEERASAVFEATGVDALIRELPKGLDTPVGERGEKLSGGQRQKVALARALLRDAQIYVLDEPTSAIRGKDAQELVRRVTAFLHDRTVLLITHSEQIAQILPNAIEIEGRSASWLRRAALPG